MCKDFYFQDSKHEMSRKKTPFHLTRLLRVSRNKPQVEKNCQESCLGKRCCLMHKLQIQGKNLKNGLEILCSQAKNSKKYVFSCIFFLPKKCDYDLQKRKKICMQCGNSCQANAFTQRLTEDRLTEAEPKPKLTVNK